MLLSVATLQAQTIDGCIYKPRYSPQKRLTFYPFNKSDTIKLISFKYHGEGYIPIKDSLLVQDSLIEEKVLSKTGIDSLTDYFYNIYHRPVKGTLIGHMTQCYFPRSAIVYLNKEGKVIEYMEICFHCMTYSIPDDKELTFGLLCSQVLDKLYEFFQFQGLKFGMDPTIDSYTGESAPFNLN